jgi:hypothetical protein
MASTQNPHCQCCAYDTPHAMSQQHRTRMQPTIHHIPLSWPQVRKLEKFNVDGHELLERLRILEDRVEVLNKTRLPDFEPADVYRRLDELAASSQQLHEAITAHKIQQEQVGSSGSSSCTAGW